MTSNVISNHDPRGGGENVTLGIRALFVIRGLGHAALVITVWPIEIKFLYSHFCISVIVGDQKSDQERQLVSSVI